MTTTIPEREYETIYILRPDAAKEVTENVASRVTDAIRSAGHLTRVENWGRRRLAHDIGRAKGGIYVYFKYVGGGGLVSEVERTLRLQESVMKFQTVKLGEVVERTDVGAEDVKFEHIEPTEDEEIETLAQTLGLEPSKAGRLAPERGYGEDEAFAQEDDNDDE